ncbi:MAG: DUF167 domain-containing protein [bacterium]
MNDFLIEVPEGIVLNIKVFPNAAKNEIGNILGNCLRIKIASAPVKGKANKECQKLLAVFFQINKSRVILRKGETSRLKQVLIEGIKKEEVLKRLKERYD